MVSSVSQPGGAILVASVLLRRSRLNARLFVYVFLLLQGMFSRLQISVDLASSRRLLLDRLPGSHRAAASLQRLRLVTLELATSSSRRGGAG